MYLIRIFFFQNIFIIFFSAAKESKERKISEESETKPQRQSISDDYEETNSESSVDEDPPHTDISEIDALKNTEEDIELFKRQLGVIDKAVSDTAEKIDRIQEALDKVLENLKLGISIDPLYNELKELDEMGSKGVANPVEGTQRKNSHEIFGRDKLLEVLKSMPIENLKNPPRLTVGMIGYPNVGKSSSVNVLMQTKKVILFFVCLIIKKCCFCYFYLQIEL